MTDLSTDEVLFSIEGAALPEGVRKILSELRRYLSDEDTQKRLRRRQPEMAGIMGLLRDAVNDAGMAWSNFGDHEDYSDERIYDALVAHRENRGE